MLGKMILNLQAQHLRNTPTRARGSDYMSDWLFRGTQKFAGATREDDSVRVRDELRDPNARYRIRSRDCPKWSPPSPAIVGAGQVATRINFAPNKGEESSNKCPLRTGNGSMSQKVLGRGCHRVDCHFGCQPLRERNHHSHMWREGWLLRSAVKN